MESMNEHEMAAAVKESLDKAERGEAVYYTSEEAESIMDKRKKDIAERLSK